MQAFFFAVFTFIIEDFLVFNRFCDDRNCTGHTKGKVIGYSSVRYNAINLPVVQYDVDSKQYEVVGPRFKGSRRVSKFAPMNPVMSTVKTNVMTKEELPQVLDVYIEGNSFISVTKSPLIDLYPVGGEADVYYNPANPKHAYVQRPLEKLSWITIFSGDDWDFFASGLGYLF